MGAAILLVDDDEDFLRMLARSLTGAWSFLLAGTLARALEHIHGGASFSAAIIDLKLPDGSGLTAVEAVRARAPLRPVIVLTGAHSPEVVNQIWKLRAEYMLKSELGEMLGILRERFTAVERERRAEMGAFIAKYGAPRHLSRRESEVLTLAVLDSDRDEICTTLEISPETLKVHVKNILLKCGHARFDDLARRLRIKARTRISGAMTKL